MIKVTKFSASWCGPCKMLAPIMDQVKSEVSGVSFLDVDVDENRDLAFMNSVSSVPTVIIEKNGEVVSRFSGVKTKADIVNLINQFK